MIDTIKNMPDVKIKIIDRGEIKETSSIGIGDRKKIIIFGVPGAFTSTCSLKHLPGYIMLAEDLRRKSIDSIYCLSVNDPSVMKAWQSQYPEGNKIIMIDDGNADLTRALELDQDYSSSFMGVRSKRFALMSDNNRISILNVEEPGKFHVSAAENILSQI